MTLLALTTESFRNLAPEKLELHPRLSLLVGDNGQGKTNLLEAMVLVSGRSSFRTSDLAEVRAGGAPLATVAARIAQEKTERTGTLAVSIGAEAREQLWEGRRISRLEASRLLPLVPLTSADLDRLNGAPSGRRRALDRLAAALDPEHGRRLSRFEKARACRARLLSRRSADRDELAVYEADFCRAGGALAEGRRTALSLLAPELARQAERLQSPFAPVDVRLRSDLPASGTAAELGAALEELLLCRREEERRAGRCLVGPQKDDVGVLSGDVPVTSRASSGENRTLVLAWTLAELALTAQASAPHAPVLLFDDFDSEWDPNVLTTFASAIPDNAQLVLTSARPEAVEGLAFGDGALYQVAEGRVRSVRSLASHFMMGAPRALRPPTPPRLVRSA